MAGKLHEQKTSESSAVERSLGPCFAVKLSRALRFYDGHLRLGSMGTTTTKIGKAMSGTESRPSCRGTAVPRQTGHG